MRFLRCWIGFGLLLAGNFSNANSATLSPELKRWLAHQGTHADTPVIVRLANPLVPADQYVFERTQRDNRLMRALQERFRRNRFAVQELIQSTAASEPRDLWIINAVALTVSAHRVSDMAMHPEVAQIDLDAGAAGGRSQRTPGPRAGVMDSDVSVSVDPVPASTTLSVSPFWNVDAVHAPDLWAKGLTGKNVVIASMDSGVDLSNPFLRSQWRGGSNSWADVHGESAVPLDSLGHGTQTLGIALGRSGIGVAPDAQWIAVKLYDHDGRARMSDIHLAFQWLLDPDGNPDTLDAPDVVNASWSLVGRAPGTCTLEFQDDIRVLQQAGIAVVFAAGNDGPRTGSSSSPANNAGVLSVGAAGKDGAIARQTSRGPSSCDGGIFPVVLAPGMQIETTDLSYGGGPWKAKVSGSSMAAPHVAGVLALLIQAYPSASLNQLQQALRGDGSGAPIAGPVNLDAAAALDRLTGLMQPDLDAAESHTMRP